MTELNLRNYAHIGDAVWELFVREYTVYKTQNLNLLHKMTTGFVNMNFQAEVLDFINDKLSDFEQEISKRARNCQIPINRRNNQFEYRKSTSLEALIGYWYLNDKDRLDEIMDLIKMQYFSE